MNPFVKLSLWCAAMAVLVLGTFAGALALGHPQGDAVLIAFGVAIVAVAVASTVVAAAVAAVAVASTAVAVASTAVAVAAVASTVAAFTVASTVSFTAAATAAVFSVVVFAVASAEKYGLEKRWVSALLGAEAASIVVVILACSTPLGITAAIVAVVALLLGIGMLGRGRALRPPSAA